jgi:hypothetical protein
MPRGRATRSISAWSRRAQDYGRVEGLVRATDTGRGLEGARVSLRRSTLKAVTDATGRYRLPRVPAGTDTLEVSYIGRQRTTQEIVVRPGATLEADVALGLAPVVLAEVEVLGSRAFTEAEALSRQQAAPNVVSVVASD